MPSTPKDAKGLLKSAIRDDNPVIFMENEVLYNLKGEVPDEEYHIPLGLGGREARGQGRDASWPGAARWSPRLDAAKRLAEEGIEAEVVDPRTLRPLDDEPIFDVGAQDQPLRGGRGGLAHRRLRRGDRRPRAARVLRRARRARACA